MTKPTKLAWLPWSRFNLHRNPFGELTRQERAELAVVNVDHIVALLNENMKAVQFIGACGRGKTTRMLKLKMQFPEASYAYVPEDPPCPAIEVGSPVLIDEAQRLSRAARHCVFASGYPLVLATHQDLSRSLRKYGYTVHTEQIGEGNSPELVRQLLNRRIEASRLSDGPIPELSLEDAERLVGDFGSDIRGIENRLYERFQRQVETHGEMRFVD